MNIVKELHNDMEGEAVAMLAGAFTLLALAPYDSWSHEGTPAQMAAFIVKDLKDHGRLGMLFQLLGLYGRQ